MTKRRQSTLLIALVLGLASALSVFTTVAMSQSTASAPRGPYMIAGGDHMMVWRIDQTTGKMSYCMRDSVSTDPKYIVTKAPFCSAWSQ